MEHQKLAQTTNSIREWMEHIQRQLDIMVGELKQVEGEIVNQEMNPSSVGDYMVQFFEGSTFILFCLFYIKTGASSPLFVNLKHLMK